MLAFIIGTGNIFDDRGEVAGSCYCKFLLRSLLKMDKRQSALHIDGPEIKFRKSKHTVSLRSPYHLSKKSLMKNTVVLQASKKLLSVPNYKFQPWA